MEHSYIDDNIELGEGCNNLQCIVEKRLPVSFLEKDLNVSRFSDKIICV